MSHRYRHPGTFALTAVCSGGGAQASARRIIVIQEAASEFGAITCYSGKMSVRGTHCSILLGEPFQIQITVNAGRFLRETAIYP